MAGPLPLPNVVVGEFVGKAHNDLMRVTEMITQYPTLANATYDWGNGDFETALGAAAHMGRKDIAELLLARGARICIFAAAMLGKIDIVKAIIRDDASALTRPGPHNISLLDHAKAGGNKDMIAYVSGLLKAASGSARSAKKAPKAKPAKKPAKKSKKR